MPLTDGQDMSLGFQAWTLLRAGVWHATGPVYIDEDDCRSVLASRARDGLTLDFHAKTRVLPVGERPEKPS